MPVALVPTILDEAKTRAYANFLPLARLISVRPLRLLYFLFLVLLLYVLLCLPFNLLVPSGSIVL